MNNKTKVAVVGVGSLGQHHARVYSELEDVELLAIVDTDLNRAKEIASKFGCEAHSDLKALDGLVDAASVVVPTSLHHQVSKTLLENGIHLLLEKPMTTTLEEADDLIAISERSGAMLQIGHIEQFNAGVRALKTHLKHPRFIECHRINPFVARGTDVHVILDLMIHDIDIILSLVDSELKEVRASGSPVLTANIDIANVRLAFENGCVANITASRVSNIKLRKIRIFQPNGYFSLDYAKQEMMIYRRMDEGGDFPEIKIDRIVAQKEESLKAELTAFIQSIRDHSAPTVSGRDGRRALEVALQIVDLIKQHEQAFPQ